MEKVNDKAATTSIAHSLLSFPSDLARSFGEARAEAVRSIRTALEAESRWHWAALLAILAVGVGLRLAFIAWRPMGYDESTTFIVFARLPYSDALSLYTLPNNHVLNTALIRAAYLIFGNAPWVIRLPACLAGIAMIPATYAYARRFYNAQAGLIAAGLVASSSWMVAYSTDGRGYTLVCLFTLLLMLAVGSLKTRWNTFAAVFAAVCGALAIYTIPIGVYPVGVAGAWLIASWIIERKPVTRTMVRDSALAILILAALTLALYSPILIRSGVDSLTGNPFIQPTIDWKNFLEQNQSGVTLAWIAWNDYFTWMEVAGGLLLAVSLIFYRRVAKDKVSLLVVALIVLPVVIVIQHVTPRERVWSFLNAIYLSTISAGLAMLLGWIGKRAASLVVPALAALMTLMLSVMVYQFETVDLWGATPILKVGEPLAVRIGQDFSSQDAILTFAWEYPSIRYYLSLHYGMDAATFVNWTQIARNHVKPQRAYIVVSTNDAQEEAPPLKIMKVRGLDPEEYSAPEMIGQFAGANLYVATLKP